MADHQTAGRGRQGRRWIDAPTQPRSLPQPLVPSSLLMSMLIAGTGENVSLVPLAAGLAVVDALKKAFGLRVGLKWPNDVVTIEDVTGDGVANEHGGQKLAGILAEAVSPKNAVSPSNGSADNGSSTNNASTGNGLMVVVGLGLNLKFGSSWSETTASDVKEKAIDLASLLSHPLDRDAVLGFVLEAMSRRFIQLQTGSDSLLADYRASCESIGRSVVLEHPLGPVEGIVEAVDDNGSLVIRTASGTERFTAGEVHHR